MCTSLRNGIKFKGRANEGLVTVECENNGAKHVSIVSSPKERIGLKSTGVEVSKQTQQKDPSKCLTARKYYPQSV